MRNGEWLNICCNWFRIKAGIIQKLKDLAARRKLEDLTIGPVLTWTNERIKEHIEKVLAIPGAQLEFGGKELTGHKIPSCYGAFEPTAISVPLKEILNEKYFDLVTSELFGPFQIITTYNDSEIDLVLEALERMEHHLTAGVVSNDPIFLQKILGNTVNGTTYAGLRARTTGAPQNHWFGPAGDPRGAGIGTPVNNPFSLFVNLVGSYFECMVMPQRSHYGCWPNQARLENSSSFIID